MAPLTGTSLPLLQLLYGRTASLGSFLAPLLLAGDGALEPEPADPPAYRDLLRRTVVAVDDSYQAPAKPWKTPARSQELAQASEMKDVLDRAMVVIFESSAPAQPSNQLTMGYTSSEWSYQAAVKEAPRVNPARPSIYAKHLNTTHTVFASPGWRTLLARIGPAPLVHAFARTSVFVALDNGCLLQVAGRPVVDLKPPKPKPAPAKRKHEEPPSTTLSGGDEPPEDGSAPTRKRRKGRNAHRRKRNAAPPPSDAPATARASAPGDPDAMDWDEADYSAAFSPGFDDADIDAELNPLQFRPAKLPKLAPAAPSSPMTPADLSLPRNRIFYAKPMVRRARLPSQKRIVCGLPEDHILNAPASASPASKVEGKDSSSPPSPHPLSLLMHIFPRQFGLDNVFTTAPPAFVSAGSVNHGDSALRAAEIARLRARKGALKVDKKSRMRGPALQAAMESIRAGWQAEDVWRWRAICCPSKITPATSTGGSSAGGPSEPVALPVEFVTQTPAPVDETLDASASMASQAIPDVRTQKSASTVHLADRSLSVLPHGDEEARTATAKAQKFINFTQPISQVTRFACGIVKSAVPLAVFGSTGNRDLILQHVASFLRLRRYESITLHSVLQGFKVNDCVWLAPAGFYEVSRITEGDARKRRELLAEFVWWLFDGFLIPLLKTNLYITDSAAYKKEVLYFRQDDWEVICRPVLKQLQATVYKELPDFEVNKVAGGGYRQLGHSQVRLLPKETGVRPIINLRRKPKAVEGAPFNKDALKSINSRLAETFSVLVHHSSSRPEVFGSSILGADDIYPRLRAFHDRVILSDGSLPRLYFAKVDVRSCFDTIEQSTLMDVLGDLLSEDEDYDIIRYNKAKLTAGQVKKRFLSEAFPHGTTPSFPEKAKAMSADRSKEVLMDKAFDSSISREQVAALLREHIQSNTIKIGNSFFRQAKGIPQGSVVSTYLCSLFYADMERKHLAFTQQPDSMLVRLVDDFLLVTTVKDKAVRFVRQMHAGHPKYGCYVAPEKTLLGGFECVIANEPSPNVLVGNLFPWCGRLIDTRTLSVMGDYSRDSGNVKNTLTVDVRRNPGASLRSKILRNVALKGSIAFNDAALNAHATVYANVYQNVAHGAMKAVHLARALSFDASLHSMFLLRVIDEVGDFAYSTVTNGAKTKAARAAGATVDIDRDIVCWLSKHAFHRVLATRPTGFVPVVKALRAALDAGPNPCVPAASSTAVGLKGGKGGKGLEGWETVVERAWAGLRGVVY